MSERKYSELVILDIEIIFFHIYVRNWFLFQKPFSLKLNNTSNIQISLFKQKSISDFLKNNIWKTSCNKFRDREI